VGNSDDLAARLAFVHTSMLRLVEGLDDEVMHRRFGANAPSIAFHLWHIARWADRLQAHVPSMSPVIAKRLGPGSEIWESLRLAPGWGMPARLGAHDTGMELSDDESSALPLPEKTALLDYVKRTFAAADRLFAATRDEDLAVRGPGLYGPESSVMLALISHQGHLQRHLGMIEALVGVAGRRGSATL
jgi:hypothetical protein